MSFDSLRDLTADARARIYYLLAPLQVALVSFGLLNDSNAPLIVAAVAAVVGFTMAGANSTSTWRTWLYGVIGAAQPLLTAYGVFNNSQAASVIAVVSAALGLGVAAAKTPSFG
ncbi:hypothetical protein [Nocardia sp. NPDC049707]|uniref:phage holin n=1 Tax=Nocardia sp. NPDC049707 TaxID=3154735 RepID=UPI0034216B33